MSIINSILAQVLASETTLVSLVSLWSSSEIIEVVVCLHMMYM